MVLAKYVVVVNLVGNKALGVYYKKLCAFIFSYLNSGCF